MINFLSRTKNPLKRSPIHQIKPPINPIPNKPPKTTQLQAANPILPPHAQDESPILTPAAVTVTSAPPAACVVVLPTLRLDVEVEVEVAAFAVSLGRGGNVVAYAGVGKLVASVTDDSQADAASRSEVEMLRVVVS
jgi:hypothetical protein